MNRIKFASDEGTLFYKDLQASVDRYFQEHNLSMKGNGKMVFKMIMYFTLVVTGYAAVIASPNLGWFYVAYVFTGMMVLLTAFNISHDAAHGVAVKSPFWNKVIFQLSFNLIGNNAFVWGGNHTTSHHSYTNIEGSDIDVLNNPLVRMTDAQPLKWYHRYQHLYVPFLYLFYSLNWFFIRELLLLVNFTSRTITVQIPRGEMLKLVFFKLFYVGYMIVCPVLFLDFGWEHVLFAFLLNHVLVSILFTAVLGVAHLSDYVIHPKPDEQGRLNMSWASMQMKTSVDFNSDSRFLNWTLGGFNAHTVHHLLPNVCHIHYVSLLPVFREVCKRHNMTYMEMPYGKTLSAHFRFLREMGRAHHFTPRAYA